MKPQSNITRYYVHRRSDSGQFCTRAYAKAHPNTTQRQTIKLFNPIQKPINKIKRMILEFA